MATTGFYQMSVSESDYVISDIFVLHN